jgi:hypothetical protein
MNAAT